jgi:hypothetical protein
MVEAFDGRGVIVGRIISDTSAIAARHWPILLTGVVALALLSSGELWLSASLNLSGHRFPALLVTLGRALASVGIHFLILRVLLGNEGLTAPSARSRPGAFLLLWIGMSIGISIGLILLIVPGLILMARWELAAQFVIAEGMDASEAAGASRDATRNARWPIIGAYLLLFLFFAIVLTLFGGVAGVMAASGGSGPARLTVRIGGGPSMIDLTTGGAGALLSAAGLAMGVALYALLGPRAPRIEEVFA